MRDLKQVFSYSRAEVFALVFLLLLLFVGGGILLHRKSTESLPPELFFETMGVEKQTVSYTSPGKSYKQNILSDIESSPINLNSAPAESLVMLPQIGEVISRRVVEYRNHIGKFDSVGQLIEVKGIGSKKLALLRKYLKTE